MRWNENLQFSLINTRADNNKSVVLSPLIIWTFLCLMVSLDIEHIDRMCRYIRDIRPVWWTKGQLNKDVLSFPIITQQGIPKKERANVQPMRNCRTLGKNMLTTSILLFRKFQSKARNLSQTFSIKFDWQFDLVERELCLFSCLCRCTVLEQIW